MTLAQFPVFRFFQDSRIGVNWFTGTTSRSIAFFHDTSSRREKYTGGVKVVGGMKWKNRIRREMLTGMKSLVGLNDSYTMSHSLK